ncbi:MAG: patatin-like phospholipase family protein [Proteobacteria bacterium]|nr:patatin-like phospholipase family protein [Pseudomonadota bacterium]
MSDSQPEKLALVLPAGGARAAYQVGILRYIAETYPEIEPKIYCGISAGSINACFLSQGLPFNLGAVQLYDLWTKLEFDQVLKTNFNSLFSMSSRWLYDMFLSKVTQKLLLKSLLDASPLAHTLLSHIHFWKVSKAIRSGFIDALSISATNYHDGNTTIFFDSNKDIPVWVRETRRAVRSQIHLRHIMASCSIPILFEPVRIGDFLFGDGSLRFNFPFSPAIHLGATRALAIGIRSPSPQNPLGFRPEHVGMGFVAGAVLNSIFLDSIEADYENLTRNNRIADGIHVKKVPALLLRPSQDLGALSVNFLNEVPFHFRQFLKSTASPKELGDLLSYLMFSPGYIKALLELGMKDAANEKHIIEKFLFPNKLAAVPDISPKGSQALS